jgi:Ca-activated chloride channel family protein
MDAPEEDLYETLGVSPTAPQEEIKRAYRALARRYHPDSGSDVASAVHFQRVQSAYDVLSDPVKRRAYDRRRAERYPAGETTFAWDILTSRQQLHRLPEEQVVYVLLSIYPTSKGEGQRLPINIALVIDRSTSMQKHRLEYVKAAAHQIVDELDEHDSLAVIAFSDRAEVVVPNQRLGNRTRIHGRVSAIWASGGTEILEGLKAGLDQVRRFHSANTTSHVVLLTDGQTYGDEDDCLAESRRAGQERICISTIGIGEDWNDALLEQMALQAGGTCFYISHPRRLRSILQGYIQGLSNVVARDLRLVVRLSKAARAVEAYRCFPAISHLALEGGEARLGLLHSESRIQVLLELAVEPGLSGKQRLAQFELLGMVPGPDRQERLIHDYETEFVINPEKPPVPSSIINAVNRVNLYRMQDQAWSALASGRPEDARHQLEAVATRLLDLGEANLAQVALLEAGRIAQGKQSSGKGQKTIRFGTRSLGMKG